MALLKAFLLLSLVFSVKSWYVCDDLDFCKRIRNAEGNENRFSIDPASVSQTSNSLQGELLNAEDNSKLQFELKSLKHDTFRFTVNDPEKPRHTVPEALDGDPEEADFDSVSTSSEGVVTVQTGPNSVEVTQKPFKIVVKREGNVVMSFNAKSRMVFNSGEDEAIALDVQMAGSRAYGIPEHADHLALKNTGPGGLDPYRFFNVDHAAYQVESREPVYGTIPVLYAHGSDNSSGIFWLNSAQTFVDIDVDQELETVNSFFISQSGAIDLFFFTGPTLADAVQQYSSLTGTAPLPQLFALGFHQSRYSYESQAELLAVVDGFDKNNFPLDVMWLDIDYTDGIKYFTWNDETFPDPLGMQDTLNSTGRKLVVIIDPHIKVEKGYFVYDEGVEKGYFVKNTDGTVYEGKCWPGVSSYIDFTNPEARSWYSTLYAFDNFPKTTENTYIWNDMNEPAVFESDENTMPLNSVAFHNGWLHRDVHNTYGFFQTKGTYEGLLQRSENKLRPFILTRSHFAGSQRYTAMWTGDNVADWPYLRISAPMCLTEALAGMSFCGADVGGFLNDVEDELLQRWFQTGAWLPFFRSHSTKGVNRREPYLFSEEIQQRLRTALNQRYVHLPYWYTLWFEHTRTAAPVIRPLSYHYAEKDVLDLDQQWLVGQDILVSPVMEKDAENVQIYLPPANYWYSVEPPMIDLIGGWVQVPVDMNTVPVFYRGGAIIPRKNMIRASSVQTHHDAYSLYVMLDQNREATGNLYVDDFESFNYKSKQYLYLKFEFKDNAISSARIDEDADYDTDVTINEIFVYAAPNEHSSAFLTVNGQKREVDAEFDEATSCLKIVDLKLSVREQFTLQLV